MPRKKIVSSGRYSKVFPGLFLGNKSSVEALMTREDVELIAVVNIGGGRSMHPNTLKFHVNDSSENSMFEIFESTCTFIETYCDIAVYPSTSRFELQKEFSKFREKNRCKNIRTSSVISNEICTFVLFI